MQKQQLFPPPSLCNPPPCPLTPYPPYPHPPTHTLPTGEAPAGTRGQVVTLLGENAIKGACTMMASHRSSAAIQLWVRIPLIFPRFRPRFTQRFHAPGLPPGSCARLVS